MAMEVIGNIKNFQTQNLQNTAITAKVQSEETDTIVIEQAKVQPNNGGSTARVVEQNQEVNVIDTEIERRQTSSEGMKQAVSEMNKLLSRSEAIFGIHEETQRVTIKIVDKETKEVLQEFPPEKALDMIARVWEMAGILIDEKR